MIDSDELPHLMFTGVAGISKTTVAKVLAKVLDREYIVINASNDRNIDMLRNEIATFASSVSLNGKDKIIIQHDLGKNWPHLVISELSELLNEIGYRITNDEYNKSGFSFEIIRVEVF